MPLTFTLEAHPTAVEHGIWCDTCGAEAVTTVHTAVVASDTLAIISRAVGSLCEACGADSVHR